MGFSHQVIKGLSLQNGFACHQDPAVQHSGNQRWSLKRLQATFSDMGPDSVATKTFTSPGPYEGCSVAGVKYLGSLLLCTAKIRLMFVAKCPLALGDVKKSQ